MAETKIEWTDWSLNPIRYRGGHYCQKVSPGCAQCYSGRMQPRFGNRDFGGASTALPVVDLQAVIPGDYLWCDDDKLHEVLRRRKPTRIFWCDMTDLFGAWVPDRFIDRCFAVMALTPQHTHQLLTKRPERMRDYVRSDPRGAIADAATDLLGMPVRRDDPWPLPGVWCGVSVEDQQRADERIPILLNTPAAVRFLSCEPLLSSVDLSQYIGLRGSENENQRIALRGGRGLGRTARGHEGPSVEGVESGGHRQSQGVLACPIHGRGQAVQYRRSPAGVDDPPSTACAGRPGDQSQERRQGRQPTVESGSGSAEPQRCTCAASVGADQNAPYPGGEALPSTGVGNSRTVSAGRIEQDGNCSPIRSHAQDHPQHRNQGEVAGVVRPGLIDWAIVGGESGPGARPCDLDWIRSIVRQCRAASVPCFVKQIGSNPVDAEFFAAASATFEEQWGFPPGLANQIEECTFRPLDRKGGDITEWPADLRVREFPQPRQESSP